MKLNIFSPNSIIQTTMKWCARVSRKMKLLKLFWLVCKLSTRCLHHPKLDTFLDSTPCFQTRHPACKLDTLLSNSTPCFVNWSCLPETDHLAAELDTLPKSQHVAFNLDTLRLISTPWQRSGPVAPESGHPEKILDTLPNIWTPCKKSGHLAKKLNTLRTSTLSQKSGHVPCRESRHPVAPESGHPEKILDTVLVNWIWIWRPFWQERLPIYDTNNYPKLTVSMNKMTIYRSDGMVSNIQMLLYSNSRYSSYDTSVPTSRANPQL